MQSTVLQFPSPASLPGGRLPRALRQGLLQAPGRPTLEALFTPGAVGPRQYVERLCARLQDRPGRHGGDQPLVQARRPLWAGAVQLERALDRSAPGDLQPAAALLGIGIFMLEAAGLPTSLTACELRHLHLHCVATSKPDSLPRAAAEAADWALQALAGWRAWHSGRFGPIQCVDWAPDRGHCRSLGYQFQGHTYRVQRLGERIQHLERTWVQLQATALQDLVLARQVWQGLAAPPPAVEAANDLCWS